MQRYVIHGALSALRYPWSAIVQRYAIHGALFIQCYVIHGVLLFSATLSMEHYLFSATLSKGAADLVEQCLLVCAVFQIGCTPDRPIRVPERIIVIRGEIELLLPAPLPQHAVERTWHGWQAQHVAALDQLQAIGQLGKGT